MAKTNQEIVARIKEARQERKMTQQQLAELLGKTSAAISDMERAKVQVSASDLSTLAEALNKPIEFFYGEEIGDKEIQDMIAILRKQPPGEQQKSIETTKMLLRMQQIGDIANRNSEQQPTVEEIRDFIGDFITFSKQINEITSQMNKIRDELIQALQEQGIDILGLPKD